MTITNSWLRSLPAMPLRLGFANVAYTVGGMTLFYDSLEDLEQMSLFPHLPSPTLIPVGRTRFLTNLAQLMEIFANSKELQDLIKQAVLATPNVGGQAWGTELESEIGRRVQMPEWRRKLNLEFVTLSQEIDPNTYSFPLLTQTKFEYLDKPGSPCDLILKLKFGVQATYSVMINVKGLTGSEMLKAIGHGFLLGTFLRLTTERDFSPRQAQNKRYDSDLALLEMLSGERKILAGRDYYLLLVRADRGVGASSTPPTFKSIRFQSLLASLDAKGEPVVSRHHSREIVQVSVAAGLIPPGYDISRRLAEALLPISRGGDIRIRIATLLTKHRPGKLREHVVAVMAMSDEEIVQRLIGSIEDPKRNL